MKKMKTLKIKDSQYEIVDASARTDINELKGDLGEFEKLVGLVINTDSTYSNGSFEGAYNGGNGNYTNTDARFMILKDFIKAERDTFVVNKDTSKYKCGYYTLTESGITKVENNLNLITDDFVEHAPSTKYFIIPSGTVYRLECRFVDNHTPSDEEKIELSTAIFIPKNLGNMLSNAERFGRKYITVGRENCDFEKLTDACSFAYTLGNCDVLLGDEVFNIIDEVDIRTMGSGIIVGNGMHIIGRKGTIIRCNYTGDDGLVQRDFSVFNVMPSDFTLENVRMECWNIRYCVHDECSGSTTPYTHKYINCDMYKDSYSAHWRTSQCIGGGFGTDGTCIVDGGVYETVAQYESKTYDMDGPYTDELRADIISWHSNNSNESAKNTLIIKNIFGDGSLSRVRYSAGSDGLVLISNNSFGLVPSPYSITPRSYLWNNTIRSN